MKNFSSWTLDGQKHTYSAQLPQFSFPVSQRLAVIKQKNDGWWELQICKPRGMNFAFWPGNTLQRVFPSFEEAEAEAENTWHVPLTQDELNSLNTLYRSNKLYHSRLRFGQFVMNWFSGCRTFPQTNSELYYMTDNDKAYAYIFEAYVRN